MKKIFLIMFILLIFISCASVYAGDNATSDIICVDETADAVNVINDNETEVIDIDEANAQIMNIEENNQVSDSSVDDKSNYLTANSDGTFSDLANEIANANGELKLTKNYIYDSSKDSNYTNGITINKEITINGRGFVINGDNKALVFTVSHDNVILRNIEFTNCNKRAVYWNGANGNLYDCNFINCHNTNTNSGGAVYWNGVNGNLYDCNFVDCYLSGSYTPNYYGGAVYWNGANGNLYDCDFINCRLSGSYDASGYNSASSQSVSSYTECHCTAYGHTYSRGGAVYWSGVNGELSGCDFIDCYSYSFSHTTATSTYYYSYSGYSTTDRVSAESDCYSCSYGGIYWAGDEGCISNSNFINSSYTYRSDYNSRTSSGSWAKAISKSNSSSMGGAVYWNGNQGKLYDCNFIKSNSSSSYGKTNILGGSSSSYAGVVYWNGNSGGLFNSSFTNPTSDSSFKYKRTVYWCGDEGNLFNCSFDGNYYNYESYCTKTGASHVYPVILIHTSTFNDDENIVIFESTQLVKNITVKLYNVTDRKILYQEFDISSEDLTYSLNFNNLEESEYQIVLEYVGDNFYSATSTNDFFKIGKTPSFEVTISENPIEGDNATLYLTLNDDATGKVKITLSYYTIIKDLVNGKTSFNIPNISGGINAYKIKYVGDENYNPLYINDTFNVLFKSNINLNLNNNSVFDENIPLTYTITQNCTGIISIYIDNVFKANISVGELYELENLLAGKHDVTVNYSGDEYFASCNDTNIITVSKANPTINVTSSNFAGDALFEVSLNEKTTGNITITFNNNPYSGRLKNGKTSITIPNLIAGDYNCIISYEGDSNYNPLTQNYNFKLKLKKSNVLVIVNDVILGEIVDVQYNLTTDATGSISVYLNNTFIKNIAIGETINIQDLTVGDYLVKLVYSGDEYYEACENTTTFNVLKLKPTIDMVSATSTSENITFGDIVTVNYHITNGVTGTISIYVDSALNKTVNIGDLIYLNGLNAGYHTIKLVYNGDINYQSCDNSVTFEVLRNNIDISNAINIIEMFYGKTKINFVSSFEGVLNINASNKYFKSFNVYANINNYLNLSGIGAGDYDVEYTFIPNDQNYYNATTKSTLTVFKSEPTFEIVINDINYKESATLNINYLNDVTGFANITISNDEGFEIKYSNVALSGSNFNKVLSNLNASEYTITFEYSGDNNYYSTTEYKTFNVVKLNPTMVVDVTDALYGQTAKIVVNCNVEGNITIKIGSVKTYSELLISDHRVLQNINDIDAGTYDVKIIYNGNTNYNPKTLDAKLTISKLTTNIIATVDDITYSEPTVINVKCSVDGVATVKIDNNYVNDVNVMANTVSPVTFYTVPAGKHNVTVILSPSNKNYANSFFNTNFTVSKKQTSITLGVEDSVYGKDVIVNVTASADGKIVLKVGDITREKNVLANTLTKINLGILAADSYDVEASLDAGENYKPSTNNDNIIISKAKAEIQTVQTQDIVYGANTIIKVKTNIGGRLTFNLGSTVKSFDIVENKLTSFDLGVLDADTYDVEVSLDAGNNYTKPVNTTKITISPKQTTANVNVKDSVFGENVIVNVSASENGKISVQVGNIVKYVDVEANKLTSIDFGILNANSYSVNVTFNGGNNYNESYDYASLVVSPAKSKIIEIQTQEYTYSEHTVIKVRTNVDGVLNATVDKNTKTVNMVANQLTDIDLGVLDVNNYEIKLNFDAGNNYISSENKSYIVINPKNTSLVLYVKNYQYNENVIINVTASEIGKVTIKLGDIIQNIDVDANKITSIDFGILNSDSYAVNANFTAGANYIDSADSAMIKVLSKLDENNVIISVPEIKTNNDESDIVVNLPKDATGTVTLVIDNDNTTFDVNNGIAIIKVPKLEEGDYDYVITYSGDDKYSAYMKAGTISVSKPIPNIVVPDLNNPSSDGSIAIKLPNDAKGTITLVIANKPYYFPVNNGVSKVYMPDLANGKYSYTITYSGDELYSSFTKTGSLTINKKTTPAKTTVKTTITLKKVTVKKSAKKLVLQATLKQGNKALSGKKIIFKFNGKKYTAKTNKKGVAKVTIKKAILKKLKVGKKVKYQASYGKKAIAKKTAKVKK